MESVMTASGIKFKTDMVSTIPSPQMLYIRIVDAPLAQIAAVFGDPAETKKITYGSHCFEDYTLDALVNDVDAIRVNLRKGV